MPLSKEILEQQKQSRLEEINYNNFGTKMKIVEYYNVNYIIVEFQDEFKSKKKCSYNNFKKGIVKNLYDKEVYNIGYIGEGKYTHKTHKDIYRRWYDMIQRCYDSKIWIKHPTYKDATVCEEWHNFQNFAKWYEDNYYECNGEKMCLDKDILTKGNKIYSPETCVFVPERINELFIKRQNHRGDLPIGVGFHKRDNQYYAQCRILDENNKKKNVWLGYFPNEPFHAFYTYKMFKEKYIKQIADKYKDLIPQRLHEAMYKWEVEVND